MAEPVDIGDGLPVYLTARQQKLWDTGDREKRKQVRKEIREKAAESVRGDEEIAERLEKAKKDAPSFDEVIGR